MNNPLINKKILHAGSKSISIINGSRVRFHYCTKRCDDDTIIDDSRKNNSPMEIIIGKKFKFEVWEAIVQTMALNEVASFTVDKSLLQSYPFVSKTIRDAKNPNKEKRNHCCAATLQSHGVGYDDLNELMKNPVDLEFIIELLSVELPDDYEKETWQLEENEKLQKIPQLKDEGNQLYNNKDFIKASEKYALAIGLLEQLMLKEKPKDKEWNELNKIKITLLLNYAQCKLLNLEFYSAIEHCTTVLESNPNNVKALYRRGKAHIGAWNFKEAEADLKKVVELDGTLKNLVQQNLNEIAALKRSKNEEDKSKLKGKIF